jgi:putrescine aminotransferase
MKNAVTVKSSKKEALFKSAGKVFSESLLEMIREKGHDFLEGSREGSYVFDTDGARYLDCHTSAGTFNLGRRNPVIAGRLKQAMYETDQGNFVMPSQEKALLAQRMSAFMPENLDCVLFGVTRGESMDAACKLARGFTKRSGLITVDNGCYGETGFALSISARKGKEQFGQLIPNVKVIPFGDIDSAKASLSPNTAALIMEPIQAENHCRRAEKSYYTVIRSLCDKHGVKLIFDETASGFGRTGRKFFLEYIDVTPDILIVGEAITSGIFPMTAMVFTPELKGFFDEHPLIHLCTFGGHDLGCRVAMAALDEYDRHLPWDNARNLGDRLHKDLAILVKKYPDLIESVRGKGLLITMRFSSPKTARLFCNLARKNNLLVDTGKIDSASVIIRPSLLITEEEAQEILDKVSDTIKDMGK